MRSRMDSVSKYLLPPISMSTNLWRGPVFDQEIDGRLVVYDALLLELHLGVEVALAIEGSPQVAGALHQQVVIHGVFLEDGHVALQFASARSWRRWGSPAMCGPASMRQVGMARIGAGVVAHGFERDVGFQAVFAFDKARARHPSAWRTRVWVTGFQVWMIQRRNLVASARRGRVHFRSPRSTGGAKRARRPLSTSNRMLTC